MKRPRKGERRVALTFSGNRVTFDKPITCVQGTVFRLHLTADPAPDGGVVITAAEVFVKGDKP